MKGSKKEREGGGKVRRNKQKHSVNPQEKALTSFCVAIVAVPSLVPRPSPAPVFDRLQYAKTEPEGLVNLTT